MRELLCKLMALIVLLLFPPSLFLLVFPSLSSMKFDNPQLDYLPNAIMAVLIILWVVDYGFMTYLGVKWWRDAFGR